MSLIKKLIWKLSRPKVRIGSKDFKLPINGDPQVYADAKHAETYADEIVRMRILCLEDIGKIENLLRQYPLAGSRVEEAVKVYEEGCEHVREMASGKKAVSDAWGGLLDKIHETKDFEYIAILTQMEAEMGRIAEETNTVMRRRDELLEKLHDEINKGGSLV